MALQTCNRCRKRRIKMHKCDLNLPACRNCSLAEKECFFYDESLQQEFPRSYLQALQQKVKELQDSIKVLSRGDIPNSSDHSSPGLLDLHHVVEDVVLGDLPEATIYLGPGTSSVVVKRLLTQLGSKHIMSKSSSSESALARFLSVSKDDEHHDYAISFQLYDVESSQDLSANIPRSTQVKLVDHYRRVVQPSFPLLTQEQQLSFQRLDDPLQWSLERFDLHNASVNVAVLAISAALVARDVEARFRDIAGALRLCLDRSIHNLELQDDMSVESSKHRITLLCFRAIYEFVDPISGQVWDIVGRALSQLEQLRLGYNSGSATPDDDLLGLELTLLNLESSLAIHFRRPSSYCETWPVPRSAAFYDCQIAAREVVANLHVVKIIQSSYTAPTDPVKFATHFIPAEYRELDGSTVFSLHSASLYLAMHHLLTSKNSGDPDSPLDEESGKLYQRIERSAMAIINDLYRLNRDRYILSLWRSSEQLFQAGVVLVSYIIHCQQLRKTKQAPSHANPHSSMDDLVKCTSLLSSFAERWQGAKVYLQIWEALLPLIWDFANDSTQDSY